MELAAATADRSEMMQQFQLAEIPINADRQESIIQNSAWAHIEICSVVRSVSDGHKRTPQSDAPFRMTKAATPSFER
jgi:hypothetical protein